MNTPEKKRFKDWFDKEAAERLATQIAAVYPAFDRRTFIRQATRNLDALEMNARVAQFSQALAGCLPENKEEALRILTRSLPPILPGTEQITGGWLQWPLGKFIADYGLPHFETAMQAMIELTQRFSSEFAIRPFIEHRQEKTLSRLLALTNHPSPHVRRWCSEGSRPLLPWGKKLQALVEDPAPVWPILEALKDDPEPYVRKSVANHLNDIAKNHPDKVIDRCRRWQKDAGPGRQWIIRHGLRTLLKDGNPEALKLLGFAGTDGLSVKFTLRPKKIVIGESVLLACTLSHTGRIPLNLMIDYAVTYLRQKGKTGRKVFKWTKVMLPPGESLHLEKTHAFRPTSIRALYPGNHRVQIQINGVEMATGSFVLCGDQ